MTRARWPHASCARLATVLLACAAGAGTAYAQDDVQLWISANTSGPGHGPYRVSAEVHARWMDDVQKYQRTVLRLQGGRALTPHVTAWFGFEETWPVAHRTVRETRIWQQVIFVQPVGTWSFSHRARLEERFIDQSDRMVPRLRYSLRATRPFHPQSAWGAVVAAEIFFQLRSAYLSSQRFPAGLDRDRVQAGISRRLTRTLTIEPAYVLQFINAPQPSPDRREHLLQLQVAHRF